MAGLFETPRNADTLCEFALRPGIALHGNGICLLTLAQSWVGRKSRVLMSASKTVRGGEVRTIDLIFG